MFIARSILLPTLAVLPAAVACAEGPEQLLDRAGASLDELAGDAADTSVLLGVPTGEQARRVGEKSRAALALIDQAESAINTQLERARLNPAGMNNTLREQFKKLKDQELGVRVPMLRGRASALAALVELSPDQRAKLLNTAGNALSAVGVLSPAAEGVRRVTLAAVITAHNTGGRAGENGRKAIEIIRSVLELPVGEDPSAGISRFTRFEAILALAQCVDAPAEVRRVSERAFREASEPLLRVLTIEATARAMKRLGAGSIDPSGGGLDAPSEVLASLGTRTDLGLAPEQAELLVYEKLAGCYRDEPRNSDERVLLARGIVLCRSESSRSAGLSLLDRVSQGIGRIENRADAAWYAASFRHLSPHAGDKLAGVRSLLELVRRQPTSRRADTAVRLAVQRGRELASQRDLERQLDGTTIFADALGVAIDRFDKSDEADQYRCELAQMTPALSPEQLRTLADRLHAVASASPHASWARSVLASKVHEFLAPVRERAGAAGERDKPTQTALARALEQALAALGPSKPPREVLEPLQLEQAEARAGAGLSGAEGVLRQLIDAGAGARVPGGAPRLTLALARAYRAAGKNDAAFNTLKDFVAPMDAPDTVAQRPPQYWLAWAEMLEILASRNNAGELSGDIRLKIRQLQLLDPTFGGEDAGRRIANVETTLR